MSKTITCELLSEKSPSFSATAFWMTVARVCDLPEPVEPTTAMCLLKNLFPLTGTGTFLFDASVAKRNLSASGTESS